MQILLQILSFPNQTIKNHVSNLRIEYLIFPHETLVEKYKIKSMNLRVLQIIFSSNF